MTERNWNEDKKKIALCESSEMIINQTKYIERELRNNFLFLEICIKGLFKIFIKLYKRVEIESGYPKIGLICLKTTG